MMTRVEALSVVIELLENYLTSIEDDLPEYKDAYKVLLRMRDGIYKQNIKSKQTSIKKL